MMRESETERWPARWVTPPALSLTHPNSQSLPNQLKEKRGEERRGEEEEKERGGGGKCGMTGKKRTTTFSLSEGLWWRAGHVASQRNW